MERIEQRIIQTAIHTLGTCPGCSEGGCFAGYHCPCDGCECWRNCGHTMLSGLTCVLHLGHEGEHYDKFGLRDPDLREQVK